MGEKKYSLTFNRLKRDSNPRLDKLLRKYLSYRNGHHHDLLEVISWKRTIKVSNSIEPNSSSPEPSPPLSLPASPDSNLRLWITKQIHHYLLLLLRCDQFCATTELTIRYEQLKFYVWMTNKAPHVKARLEPAVTHVRSCGNGLVDDSAAKDFVKSPFEDDDDDDRGRSGCSYT